VYSKEEIIDRIRHILDPEVGFPIVDMGLIYDARQDEDGTVTVTMTLTTPACPIGPQIGAEVVEALEADPRIVSAEIEWTFSPPWNPAEMASEEVRWAMGIFD
jgi:metal-sulfur cluster biosynthetic enzyme